MNNKIKLLFFSIVLAFGQCGNTNAMYEHDNSITLINELLSSPVISSSLDNRLLAQNIRNNLSQINHGVDLDTIKDKIIENANRLSEQGAFEKEIANNIINEVNNL